MYPRHYNKGVDKHLFCKVPPIIVYSLSLVFSRLASDGSHGRLLSSIYSQIKDIQDGKTVLSIADTIFPMGGNWIH